MASINGTNISINCLLDSSVEKGRFIRIVGQSGAESIASQASISAASSGHNIIGVALSSGVSGDSIDVQIFGICSCVRAGAEIWAGSLITTDSSGKAVTAVSGDRSIGRLVCGNDGANFAATDEECTVLLNVVCDVA